MTDKSTSSAIAQTEKPQPVQKADKSGKMHANSLHVVVRLTQSKGLEGAFRVQVLPESLQQAGLTTGDLCEISSEDGTTGYGIAWRADDKINRPKHRPAKMTETFQSAFGFEEGSKVTISKTDAKIHRADKIVLCDVTPPEYSTSNDADDGLWKSRIIALFAACEAIAPGISFDVSKRKAKKRYYVESIEAANVPTDCLYTYGDATELVFRQDSARPSSETVSSPFTDGNAISATTDSNSNETRVNCTLDPNTNGIHDLSTQQHRLNTDRIGGLIDQCQILNRQMQRLLNHAHRLGAYGRRRANPPVLLHGYEGTGKSMLLKRLGETAGFSRVVRLDRSTLTGGTIANNQKIIKASFDEAADNEPSLMVMDNLEKLAPSDDVAYSSTIVAGFERIRNSRVMVVGTTRTPNMVETSLIGPGCFERLVELHIPDLAAREQIMNVLQGKPAFAKDTLSTIIASRTHGFTGRDMAKLYTSAAIYAADRFDNEQEEMAMARTPTPPAYDTLSPFHGTISSAHNATSSNTDDVLLRDFEFALHEVKPTALREIFTEKPKTSWNDIGGSQEVKESFDRIIGWPLQHKAVLAMFSYQPPKGVLLYGPPGCSKTLTAQAVANMYNFNFIAVKGAELVSMYVGESERSIREVFRKARTAAPCVVFFDEIDAIGSNRDGANTGLNVLTTLLNEMDGFEALRDVFILAATNKPETLDPALMRPGRFDSHVYLGPPNELARREILNIATLGVALATDVAFERLVTDTAGFSGAEIVRICHSAKEPAIERRIRGEDARVTAADFEAVLSTARKGITQEMLDAYETFSHKREH